MHLGNVHSCIQTEFAIGILCTMRVLYKGIYGQTSSNVLYMLCYVFVNVFCVMGQWPLYH